jgi:hypothetical protein
MYGWICGCIEDMIITLHGAQIWSEIKEIAGDMKIGTEEYAKGFMMKSCRKPQGNNCKGSRNVERVQRPTRPCGRVDLKVT